MSVTIIPSNESVISDFNFGYYTASNQKAFAIAGNGARKSLIVVNFSNVDIYLGDAGVTQDDYLAIIPAGKQAIVETDYQGEYYAVCNSGSPVVFLAIDSY